MNRQHPFFSPLGCLGGSVLIIGIVITVVFTGGLIFSPGGLTALALNQQPLEGFNSHAEFEAYCNLCHVPFQGVTAERCEACHTAVHDERASGQGLHGRLEPAAAADCASCHADHQGQAFDPTTAAIKQFDHTLTRFQLKRHLVDYSQAPLECQACHRVPGYTVLLANCAACHAAADTAFMRDHAAAFGEACLDCHDGEDKMAAFDHAQTPFPLQGEHAPLACGQCHRAETAAADTPADCASCHQAPDTHTGVLTGACADCHTPAAWSPADLPGFAAFRHAQADFQLVNHLADYAGRPLTCAACHAVPAFSVNGPACVDCHRTADAAFLDQHLLDYGPDCVSCHDGAGNMKNFDHALVFALDGQHAALACEQCHAEQRFRGTPRECAGCHAEPEVHAGIFGLKCEACHTAAAWSPAQLTQHTFPLDHGGQGEIPCETCHAAKYTEYTCYGCHEHEPAEMQREHNEVNLNGQPLEACMACHPDGRKKEGGD